MMKTLISYTLFFLSLVIAPSIMAGDTGRIEGRVVDEETEEPFFGISVIIEGTSLGAVTNLEGNYAVLNLLPGTYTVSVSKVGGGIGYKEDRKIKVKVTENQTTEVNFSLEHSKNLEKDSGKLIGKLVEEKTGKPIPNTNVIIERLPRKTTDKNGFFAFNKIPSGNYTVLVEINGYLGDRKINFEIAKDQVTEVNYSLEIANFGPIGVGFGLEKGYAKVQEDETKQDEIPVMKVEGKKEKYTHSCQFSLANPRPFRFNTEDGVEIVGTFYHAVTKEKGSIVLLHMLSRNRSDWKPFEKKLNELGYRIYAIDLRGHGESVKMGEEVLDFKKLRKEMYQKMTLDVKGAVNTLGREKVLLIGASIGGNVALNYAATDERVKGVVLLSAGLDYRGVKTEEAMKKYGDRPVLIVASEEDKYAYQSAKKLYEIAQGEKELKIYQDAGHGTRIFDKEEGLEELITTWLEKAVGDGKD
jgi:pimeloyl-ACP methyl ester carboxylesterase